MRSAEFEIHESQQDGFVRLMLLGHLDMSSAPRLKQRLNELHAERQSVVMDLSQLEFMDSSGLWIVIQSITSAASDGWRFTIDPNLAPHVQKLFQLANVDRYLSAERTEA